jgi:hypothetical protein
MSTSDPYAPNGETAPDPAAPAAPEPTPEPASAPAPAPMPVPASDETSGLYTTRGAASRAAAAHAAARPNPTAPPGLAETQVDGAPTAVPAPGPAAVPPTTPASEPPVAVTAADQPERVAAVPEPVPPRSTGIGGHVWGVVVGALVTPAAVAVALVGQSRILNVEVGAWDASLDVLGIVLVSFAAVVLAGVVYLGLWTAAAPITGGILVTGFGAVYLYAPGIARDQTMRWLATAKSSETVSQATVAGTSGLILLVGILLLVTGLTLSFAKRQGRALGAFRERAHAA